mmetsp:Transcript_66905/g.160196  ORF Transcript_66905/g.160196 Transcript_66905/m.160196 type:complete len:679 (-) Transcript_66905:88-2124(-)
MMNAELPFRIHPDNLSTHVADTQATVSKTVLATTRGLAVSDCAPWTSGHVAPPLLPNHLGKSAFVVAMAWRLRRKQQQHHLHRPHNRSKGVAGGKRGGSARAAGSDVREDAHEAADGPHASDSEIMRRTALAGMALAGLASSQSSLLEPSGAMTDAGNNTLFTWLPGVTNDEEERVFGAIESDPQWSLDFIVYLSRFLLNYDQACARWWSSEVLPTIPSRLPAEARSKRLRDRFADFVASVEFGLRRYPATTGRSSSGMLRRLMATYGNDEESRRHLALAFTLLRDQPYDLISQLLQSQNPNERLQAVFSPALPDFLAQDPLRLLPSTQYPVWDGSVKRWVIPGLRRARPYSERDALQDPSCNKCTVFGPRGGDLVSKERQLTFKDYALFSFAGAFGCSLTHSVVIPLDVVKTRMQTEPGRFEGGLVSGAVQLKEAEGVEALTLGWQPTVLGYLWYGFTVYPGYEFFKRLLLSAVGAATESERILLVILAGALATVIAVIGVCPAEACRIRMVADPSLRGKGLMEVVDIVSAQDGPGYFYDGLPTILARQVLFGMMKFLVFDYFGDFIFDLFPRLADAIETQLLVSLVSGAVAGVVSSIVSQPADTILSKINQGEGRRSLTDAAMEIWNEQGVPGFFLGLGSRCIWAGCIISGQFFLYDVCKTFLGVRDLRVFLDVQI